MSNRTIKRILKEKIKYYKDIDTINKEGIYLNFNDDNMMKAQALIIGPEDTPYEHGFYLFDFTFPKQYPHKPPKCLFLTTDGRTRMNPNLYENGYTCLSLLGTWGGPGWTSCQSLYSVCMSLRGLVLNKNPIQNEPSWENETGKKSKTYIRLLNYENLRVAVLKIINNIPKHCECFKDIIIKKYEEYLPNYLNKIRTFKTKEYEGTVETAPIWHKMAIKYDYTKLEKKFIDFAKKNKIYDMAKHEPQEESIETTETKTPKKKYKRQAPKTPSKNLTVGTKMISESNGLNYIVTLTKTGKHRWKKLPTM